MKHIPGLVRITLCCLGTLTPSLTGTGRLSADPPALLPPLPPSASDRGDPEQPPPTPYRNWKYIVLHHSATVGGSVESIDAGHRQRKDASGRSWLGIGYHFVIGNGNGMPDGQLQATFRWQQQRSGAHAGNSLFNEYGIGICLIGNFEQSGPTPEQLKTLNELVRKLKQMFQLTDEQIIRHGDLKATACPGKLFRIDLSAEPAGRIVPAGGEDIRNRLSIAKPEDMEEADDVAKILRMRRTVPGPAAQ